MCPCENVCVCMQNTVFGMVTGLVRCYDIMFRQFHIWKWHNK